MKEYTLTIELVPRTCWGKNLRSSVPNRWESIRKYVVDKAAGYCAICEEKTNHLHAHEQWAYDDKTRIQKLTDVIAICPLCHEVKHLGHTQKEGRGEEAKQHFLGVNGAAPAEYSVACSKAKKIFDERSKHEWEMDTTWLENQTIDFGQKKIKCSKNQISFSADYILLDVETTGLNEFDEIIEVAALRVVNHEVVETFSSLVNPCDTQITRHWVDAGGKVRYKIEGNKGELIFNPVTRTIQNLTGITNEMLIDAPHGAEVFPKLCALLGNEIIVGCRTSFDMKFVGQAFEKYCNTSFDNKYIDIQSLAKRLCFDLNDYKLTTMATYFSIDYQAHRAKSDCICTKKVFECLRKVAEEKFGSVKGFEECVASGSSLDLILPSQSAQIESFFVGNTFFFAGRFEWMDKKAIQQELVNKGAILSKNMNSRVKYVVVSHNAKVDSLRSKITKEVTVVSEEELYDMLERQDSFSLRNDFTHGKAIPSLFDIGHFTTDEYHEKALSRCKIQFQRPQGDMLGFILGRDKTFISELLAIAKQKCERCGQPLTVPNIAMDWAREDDDQIKRLQNVFAVCDRCNLLLHMQDVKEAHPIWKKRYLDTLRHFMKINDVGYSTALYAYRKFLYTQKIKQAKAPRKQSEKKHINCPQAKSVLVNKALQKAKANLTNGFI